MAKRTIGSHNRNKKKIPQIGHVKRQLRQFEIRRGDTPDGEILGTVIATSPRRAALAWSAETVRGLSTVRGQVGTDIFVGQAVMALGEPLSTGTFNVVTKPLGLGRVGDTGTLNVVKVG